MTEQTTLTLVAVALAVALGLGLLYLARRAWPVDEHAPQVRLLGAYSPVLTWLKYRRLPKLAPKPAPPALQAVADFTPAPAAQPPPAPAAEAQVVATLPVAQAAVPLAAEPSLPWQGLRLGLPLILAGVPAALVVADRWFANARVQQWLRDYWCAEGLPCVSALPAYMLIILPCLALAGLAVYLQADTARLAWLTQPSVALPWRPASPAQAQAGRVLLVTALVGLAGTAGSAIAQARTPGLLYAFFYLLFLAAWTVLHWPAERVAAWWQQWRRPALAAALAHVSLVAWLASYYGGSAATTLAGVLCLLAFANLWRYRRLLHPLYWLVSVALILYSLNLNAWWLAVVGDEFSFFTYAAELARGVPLRMWSERWFSGQAVYGAHPFFSSFLQAAFMKLLGVNNFGWRFSSLYLSAMSLPLFYAAFRRFVQRPVALLAVTGLAASHYVMSFGKIGYNNLQALFVLGLVLAAAAWASHRPHGLALAGFGAALGLCFYVYPAALYALPVGLLLYVLYTPLRGGEAWRAGLLIAASFGLLLAPLLWQPGYWQEKIAGTLFYNAELTRSTGFMLHHLLANLGYSALSFLYLPHETHFVVVGFIDPLSATLLVLGFAVLLRQSRLRFAAFVLFTFALMLFLVGASHDRQFPPVTRMFLLLPWFCLLAALGLYWVWAALGRLGWSAAAGRLVVAGALGAIFILNLYQAYVVGYWRFAAQQRLESLYLRMAQSVQVVEGQKPKTFLFITDPDWGIDGMYMLQDVYKVPTSPSQLAVMTITGPELSEAERARAADPNTLVIPKPWLEPSWLDALSAELSSLGKQDCAVRTDAGQYFIRVWLAPEAANLCPH
jgi:hypothetical protein